ncbi:SID1 transmembrane family member 1-like isoform X2 [Acanthaster planci]|uniref:SID1 transmembrane family member 1-like isoform X2 n=1 Tax=Acanthaster planci TaxID=133434 RepID=A0A8B7ZRA0_ACAPL|nr:SID1 transmembrane family member 1-like isoform X2 [Acanthaster planci]
MRVKAISTSDVCTVISVQPAKCPVYDQHRNVEFLGQFQTVTKQGAITVQKTNYPGGYFFVVVVVQPTDKDCLGKAVHLVPIQNMTSQFVLHSDKNRSKEITITVETILPLSEYWKPIVTTVAVLLSFYVITGFIILVQSKRKKAQDSENLEEQGEEENRNSIPFAQNQTAGSSKYGTAGDVSGNSEMRSHPLSQIPEHEADLDEDDIDMLEDVNEEKEIYRTKTAICVGDLARKKPKTLDRKYKLYYWNILTIAVFYALPAVQLVMTYQAVLNMSGNEDMCYYNFLCAMPLGQISAFNNVFSNIGYVMLGILYLMIVWKKHHIHKQAMTSDSEKAKTCGIPKHFGMFYALGIALVMEGVLSASYHVCPNSSNYQFDTAFMYIIAGLGMLMLYQQRHPDVNANAYAAFATFAAVIFVAFLGVVFVSIYFYIAFAVLHVITCLAVSTQIYYMGTWKLDLGMFKRALIIIRTELCKCAKPVYIDRMIVLTVANAINWSIMIFSLAKVPKDFNSYLLAIFLVNLLLYVAFYIIMKVRYGERLIPAVVVIVVMALVVWGLALNFYFRALTGWEKTAALSRESNGPCLLMRFYDGHDVWHILSAAALFLSFLLVLLMDEDLDGKNRMKIPVF